MKNMENLKIMLNIKKMSGKMKIKNLNKLQKNTEKIQQIDVKNIINK